MAHWRRDLSAMRGGGLLMVHPGVVVSRDPIGRYRAQEAAALAAGAIARALAEFGLSMGKGGRPPW